MNRFVWGFLAFAATSVVCFVAFVVQGSFVGADGFLNQPFYLIPFGWLFALVGAVSLMIGLAKL